ncbi:MAG: nitronate monooxygenase [Proteobacteria bacterium]|nr:nitronate monooxygenase [Pseudomonadota bacterium]
MTQTFKTRITEMLGIEHPILMGGMQWISRAEFVASVCNAGGTGFITAETMADADELRSEIRKMRTLTDKPFGVNISMLPEVGGIPERTLAFLEVVCEEGIPFVETAGRKPDLLMPRLKESGIKVIHKLTSVRHAVSAQKVGVDAVTMIGYGSGGHVGLDDVANFILIPQAVRRLDIPVIAGGGIADGRGFLGALAMGAEAVLLGTAFFASRECPVHEKIKGMIIETQETDTVLVMGSLKNPARVARNRLAEEVLAMEARGTTLEELLTKIAGRLGKEAYYTGDADMSTVPCGQAAGLIDRIRSVREIVDGILSEAEGLLDRLNGMRI